MTEYQPSWAARTAHGIPHFSYKLVKESHTWNITSSTFSLRNVYIQSLISPSVILISIEFALIGSLLLFWAYQYRGGITTRPPEKLLQQMPMSWARTVAARKTILSSAFSALLVITFVAMTVTLYGFSRIALAVMEIDKVALTFSGIQYNGEFEWLSALRSPHFISHLVSSLPATIR